MMTATGKNQQASILILLLLMTLFFGLRPNGFRFVNQVKHIEKSNCVEFSNIGIMYSEKTMEEIGITDSMTIVFSLRPSKTERQLSKIVTFINEESHELLAIEQWTDCVLATLYQPDGKRATKAGIQALSKDSVKKVFFTINRREMNLAAGKQSQRVKFSENTIPVGYFSNAQMTIGLSTTGGNPFRGEIHGLTLFSRIPDLDSVFMDKKLPLNFANIKPAALFDLSGIHKGRVCDLTENRCHLRAPLFLKIFKYKIFQPLNGQFLNHRSFMWDTLINFFGFMPLGIAAYLFFFAKSKKTAASLAFALVLAFLTSFFIETTQIFIPTRESQISDLLLNVSGAGAGVLFLFFAGRKLNHRIH